jgi:hypothetical protein
VSGLERVVISQNQRRVFIITLGRGGRDGEDDVTFCYCVSSAKSAGGDE